MTDTTAQIAAKGCKSTGITEDLALKFYDQLGRKHAIVELSSHARSENEDGKQSVTLQILSVEPVAPEAEDHVRNLQRAMFMNRRLHSEDGQLTIDTRGDLEPTIEGVLAARAQYEPHTYVDTADATCDICGDPAGASLHQVLTDDEEPQEEDQADELEDPAAADNEAGKPDPWEYPEGEGPAPADATTVKDPFAVTT